MRGRIFKQLALSTAVLSLVSSPLTKAGTVKAAPTKSANAQTGCPSTLAKVDAKSDAMVVLIFDPTCTIWCTKVKPIMAELKGQLSNVRFVEIDASNMKQARETAKKLRISGFLASAADFLPEVGVFDRNGRLTKELTGYKTKSIYLAAIEQAVRSK